MINRWDIHPGLEVLPPGSHVDRHIHTTPYAAIILDGGYQEAGMAGRCQVEPGDVVVHGGMSAHLDLIGGDGVRTLNLHLHEELPEGVYRLPSVDDIVRIAAMDQPMASQMVAAALQRETAHRDSAMNDWVDDLARGLARDPSLGLSKWARSNALDPATVSRGFRKAYGVTAKYFRGEARARLAWRHLRQNRDPLADLAAMLGFADQAHMTRAVRQLTGATPQQWRQLSSRPARS